MTESKDIHGSLLPVTAPPPLRNEQDDTEDDERKHKQDSLFFSLSASPSFTNTTTPSQFAAVSKNCTMSVIRKLTEPLLETPSVEDLREILTTPWPFIVPVDTSDLIMRQRWQEFSAHSPLFRHMMHWVPGDKNDGSSGACQNKDDTQAAPRATLSPYFALDTHVTSPFFNPWVDIGKRLQQLLLHHVACRHHGSYLLLSTYETDLFLATGPDFCDAHDLANTVEIPPPTTSSADGGQLSEYFLLRCRYDRRTQEIQFGYHHHGTYHTQENDNHITGRNRQNDCGKTQNTQDNTHFHVFHAVVNVSIRDDPDWRLKICILLTNLARVMNCLKDYTVPLVWCPQRKRRLIRVSNTWQVQKRYESGLICPRINATVANMLDIYQRIQFAQIPHTDRLMSVVEKPAPSKGVVTICAFAPVGRAYPPMDWSQLLDALLCVAETLVALHELRIMHRDIRWGNVMHALHDDAIANATGGSESSSPVTTKHDTFIREWILFDFEYAVVAPQPSLGVGTLTPGNHAPEMVLRARATSPEIGDTPIIPNP